MSKWTIPNESRIWRRVLILKNIKKRVSKSVAGKFVTVKYRPEMYYWTQNLNREDYGVDKYWVIFFFSRLRN
jgi:hypothetical protein